MLGTMYMINLAPKDRRGVILNCKQRSHTVSVNEFNERLGCARRQAAQAMLKHVHNEHSKAPSGTADASDYGTMVLRFGATESTRREPAPGSFSFAHPCHPNQGDDHHGNQ